MKGYIDKVVTLGNHRLINCDCREKDKIEYLVGNQKIDLILTDPPYGVGYVENKKGFLDIKKDKAIANDDLSSEDKYLEFSKAWLSAVTLHLAGKNSCYIFNSDRMLFSLRQAMADTGFRLAQLLIWVKNNQVLGRRDYLAKHELIAYGWHGSHSFYKAQDKSVIFYPRPNRSPYHPTTKPVGLLRRLILNSTKIGDVVYDPFLGSGSTLLACEQTGRVCLAAEIEGGYFDISIDRYKKMKGK